MTAVDPFTAASATYRAATEKPFKQGSAFEAGAARKPSGITLAAVATLIFLAGFLILSAARGAAYEGMRARVTRVPS